IVVRLSTTNVFPAATLTGVGVKGSGFAAKDIVVHGLVRYTPPPKSRSNHAMAPVLAPLVARMRWPVRPAPRPASVIALAVWVARFRFVTAEKPPPGDV